MLNTANDEPVWYLSFGSNLQEDRFHCYIQGGKPEGSRHEYAGCVDKTLPSKWAPCLIDHALYFASTSSIWSGGIAFIERAPSGKADSTLARRYLISKSQLEDLVAQENGALAGDRDYCVDLSALVEQKSIRIGSRLYDLLVLIGLDASTPIVTLTRFEPRPVSRPSPEYLRVIIRGLRETFASSSDDIYAYLSAKGGIQRKYGRQELLSVINNALAAPGSEPA